MASETTKSHPYHMVAPSPWPAIGSLAALVTAFGAIWAMQGGPIWLFVQGVLILLWVFYRWWRDVVIEARGGVRGLPERSGNARRARAPREGSVLGDESAVDVDNLTGDESGIISN